MEWGLFNFEVINLNETLYILNDIENNLDPKILNQLRDLVYQKSGIKLDSSKESLIRARIGKRMRSLGIYSYEDYLKKVIDDKSEDEVVHLLDVISTNVTSFFRGMDHFGILSNLIKDWVSSGQKSFKIWSSACSSGEEPYSIAMTVLNSIESSITCKILATDISTKVLQKAQDGIYEQDKVEQIPKIMKDKYLEIVNGSEKMLYQVKPCLKQMITFKRLNLSEIPFPMRGPIDVVFCRNVMIYFDAKTRQNLVSEIHRLLKPNGYLFIGHAESLIGTSVGFKIVRPSIYVKE